MRRSIGLAMVTIAALALVSVPARAQVPSLMKFEVTPWVGYYVPATDLAEQQAGWNSPASLNSSLAYGGNLGIRLPMGIAIEAQVGFSPTEVEGDFGSGPVTADLDVLFGAANLQWRFGPPLIPVKPYLTAGAGFVRWSPDGGESSTNIAGNLGGGAYVSVGPIVKLRGDARAYITTFNAQDVDPSTADESKFQSHFVVSAGLVFEFGG
ncbi:MAG: outer membrane protein [Gemmatimonadota bacterium]